MTIAIYFTNGSSPDAAIINGLRAASCDILQISTITETLAQIKDCENAGVPVVLVGELQAGTIPLLTLLCDRERVNVQGWPYARGSSKLMLPVLIYDREGADIHAVIRALQFGVRDYLLADTPEPERELASRLLVERSQTRNLDSTLLGTFTTAPEGPAPTERVVQPPILSPPVAQLPTIPSPAVTIPSTRNPARRVQPGHPFEWDPSKNVIHCANRNIYVSPTEARIFDLLARNQGNVVGMNAIIERALQEPSDDLEQGIERVRTHVMKLRRKLDASVVMANRIINVRSTGYMLV